MFFGSLILFAAVIAWFTGMWMNPETPRTPEGVEHVRPTVVTFVRNSAIGTLILSALAAYLLFPSRRPPNSRRDTAVGLVIAILVISSLYSLAWLRFAVLR